jgi:hypothetical protein
MASIPCRARDSRSRVARRPARKRERAFRCGYLGGYDAWYRVVEECMACARNAARREIRCPVTSSWLGPPHVDKCLRRARHIAQQQTRFESMWSGARGACLTWSQSGGWQVVDALTPANRDVRHRRLLGLSDGRPWYWLYRSVDGQFVARWENARLRSAPRHLRPRSRDCGAARRFARASVVTRSPTLPWCQ